MNGERIYATLLGLYPKPFRARFGPEMIQWFRDSAADMPVHVLWLEVLKDCCAAVPREWRREIEREDGEIDYTGIADAFMVSLVVGTLLLGWGWAGATVTLGLNLEPGIFGGPSTIVLAALVTLGMAVLVGIISVLAVTRRRTDMKCSQLINYERITVRWSR